MAEANQVWPDLQDEVWIENDNEHLARLEATELPAGVTRLQERLTSLFPRIGIAQLLLEVNHWIGIGQLLTNLNIQEPPIENLTAKKIAVLMSEGTYIGLQNMSCCARRMSYADLAGVYDRYFREDTLYQAIVSVVNFYHKLSITRSLGDGTASSSDLLPKGCHSLPEDSTKIWISLLLGSKSRTLPSISTCSNGWNILFCW